MEELKYHYKYPHPCVTTDCVIFGFDGTKLNVLLIERGIDPFKGRWAFPGGFLKMDETALQGASQRSKSWRRCCQGPVVPARQSSIVGIRPRLDFARGHQ